jgi:ribosome-associated protein
MEEIFLRENEEYIKLGQALKKAGIADSGITAKEIILDGEVLVNNESENRRGRKLYKGDIFSFQGEEFKVSEEK